MYSKKIIFSLLLLLPLSLFSKDLKTCVYINSYHVGYYWSDGISKEIKKILKDTCKIVEFGMDSKRNRDKEFLKNRALEAKKLIDSLNPDVVITSDDNAAKYLIKPYYKDSKIPFVFCGVNWTVEEYDFPYKNVKGIIEIKSIKAMFEIALNITTGNKVLFLGEKTLSDSKDLLYLKDYAKRNNIILDTYSATTVKNWKMAYLEAQKKYDFIVLGNYASIKNWNDKDIYDFIFKNSKVLSLCTYQGMIPYSMVSLVSVPEEQGIWAANTAKAILDGYSIKNVLIATNKRWAHYLNMELLNLANIKVPRSLLIKSKKYERN
ncbi:ABC transporter substrate binding protein [Sulfurimonas sp.]|uniref:ABC transporter substrate-binding protein n=1 Tax=Sulfurimonas sp. TaxID=2022749 RepID=UPI0025E4C59F|nr:ABC transporter substrate binding protein [Sulfurimonas sp.]